jgi:hypothetical protein
MSDLRDLLGPADAELHAEIMKNAPMTAVIVDRDHKIVKVLGDTLLSHLGYHWPNEVIGKDVEIFLPTDLRGSHKHWFDEWMAHPKDRPLKDASTMTVQKEDGAPAKVRIVLRKLYMEDGGKISKDYVGRPFTGGIAYVVVEE